MPQSMYRVANGWRRKVNGGMIHMHAIGGNFKWRCGG